MGKKLSPKYVPIETNQVSRTRAELLIDHAPDLVELVEVRSLQQGKEVPHAGLFPCHGGVSLVWCGGGLNSGYGDLAFPTLWCLPAWGTLRAAHRYSRQAPLCHNNATFSEELFWFRSHDGHMTTPTAHGKTCCARWQLVFIITVMKATGKTEVERKWKIWCWYILSFSELKFVFVLLIKPSMNLVRIKAKAGFLKQGHYFCCLFFDSEIANQFY